MSKLKKAVLIVFTLLFVMNLQINTSLTEGMNGTFSLTQLVENVFFPSVYATSGGGAGGSYDCFYTDWGGQQTCYTNPEETGCDCDGGWWD